MIQVKQGEITIMGSLSELMAELSTLVHSFYEKFPHDMVDFSIETGKLDKAQLAEAERAAAAMLAMLGLSTDDLDKIVEQVREREKKDGTE